MGGEDLYSYITALHPGVTGSCNWATTHFPNRHTIDFLVDCGMFQEKEYDELNKGFPFEARKISFCLITHNHVDHIGRLPLLVKNGFRGKIYVTETTSKLLPLALEDNYKVLKDTAKRKKEQILYNEADVNETLNHIVPCKFGQVYKPHKNIKVTFLNNGHLVGAAMILVQIKYPGYRSINLLFTGDYNNKNVFFKVNKIPKSVLNMPISIIQESTYGNRNSSEIVEVFEKNILDCVNNGGTAIVPVFSLGRTQEILYKIRCMQDSGKLDRDIPIYLDGKLAIRYTELYIKDGLDNKPEMRNFLPSNFKYVDKTSRPHIIEDTNRKIVLSSSGMGSYGPILLYIQEYITRKNCLIHFTGYTAEGTLGRRLKDAKHGESVEVGGLVVIKDARVEYTTEVSAHANSDVNINFLKQFVNLSVVLINHGQPEVQEIYARKVIEEVKTKKVGILGKQYVFMVNGYGLVKTLPSEFK